MWIYEKKLQFPVNIKNSNPKLAKFIISQLGGLNYKKLYIIFVTYLPKTTTKEVVHNNIARIIIICFFLYDCICIIFSFLNYQLLVVHLMLSLVVQ